jgi:hypothetical protein
MATSPNRWTVSVVALAVVLAACQPCVTPQSGPPPLADEPRPVATRDPAADDPWLHVRGRRPRRRLSAAPSTIADRGDDRARTDPLLHPVSR